MGNNNLKDCKLICTNCRAEYSSARVNPRCDKCKEPLEFDYFVHSDINYEGDNQTILERYINFFPFNEVNNILSLNEGMTSLIKSHNCAEKSGLKNLFLKNETQNPTWSFKDRGTIAGLQHAVSMGYSKIGTVSTGNMAVSVAAYGARAGIKTYILVSSSIPEEKLAPIAIYDPVLIKVDGNYGDLYFESLKIGEEHGIYFINSDVFMRVEGSKTIAYEICEQTSNEPPDFVIVPTSAGGNIRGIIKGFEELKINDMITKIPIVVCAQASGCSPIHNAFSNNKESITRIEKPETIAHAIENPFPPSGNQVLRKLKEIGGLTVSVTDDEIISAQRLLATDGIFAQPAGAVPIAAANKLLKENIIEKDDKVVCVITGSGLKYTSVLSRHKLNILNSDIKNLNQFIKGI